MKVIVVGHRSRYDLLCARARRVCVCVCVYRVWRDYLWIEAENEKEISRARRERKLYIYIILNEDGGKILNRGNK